MAEASTLSLPNHLTKRIRSACDRCHSSKLRCKKLPDSGQCVRCVKARTPCVFSPANRGFRPNPDADKAAQSCGNGAGVAEPSLSSLSSSSSPSLDEPRETSQSPKGVGGSANEFDIDTIENNNILAFDSRNSGENDFFTHFNTSNANDPAMFLPDVDDFNVGDLDFGLAEELQSQTDACFPSFYNEMPSISNSLTSSTTSSLNIGKPCIATGLYVQRLTGLSMNLYEHASILIPADYSMSSVTDLNSKYCQPDGSDFPIDKTFSHTQTLLEIMDELFPKPPSSIPIHAIFDISRINQQIQFQHLLRDPSTMLLVLSCYLRLVDIYEMLFEHLQKCLAHWNNDCLENAIHNKIAQCVQVGSYNADSPMTASLAVLNIFLTLSRQLFDRMRGITGVMGNSDGREALVSKSGHAEVTETVFKSAEKRTHEASQKFNSVRMQLFQLGVL